MNPCRMLLHKRQQQTTHMVRAKSSPWVLVSSTFIVCSSQFGKRSLIICVLRSVLVSFSGACLDNAETLPMESEAMHQTFRSASSCGDFIILDSPPPDLPEDGVSLLE